MERTLFLLACLSPETLNRSYAICYLMVAVSTAFFAIAVFLETKQGLFSWLALYLPVWLLQPGWRLGWEEISEHARQARADCGFPYRGESIFLMAILGITLIAIARHWQKRVFFLRLAIGCWLVHILIFLLTCFSLDYTMALMISPQPTAAEISSTIQIGQAGMAPYTVLVTVICCALYAHRVWKTRRGPAVTS